MEKNRPVHEVKVGRVRAAIWENETRNGLMHTVTVTRLFKDGDQWRDSSSFGRDDLLAAVKALDLAHSWLLALPEPEAAERSATALTF